VTHSRKKRDPGIQDPGFFSAKNSEKYSTSGKYSENPEKILKTEKNTMKIQKIHRKIQKKYYENPENTF